MTTSAKPATANRGPANRDAQKRAPPSGFSPPVWTSYGLLLLALLMVAIAAFVAVRTTGELTASVRWVSDTQSLLKVTSEADAALAESEAGMFGFLLTGQEQWLQTHLRARTQLSQRSDAISIELADNPEQASNTIRLREAVTERIRTWDNMLAAYANAGNQPSDALLARLTGLAVSRIIRKHIIDIERIENRMLDARSQRMQDMLDQTRSTILIAEGLALLAAALGLWLLRRSRRAWEQQRLAEMDAIRAQRESEEKSLFLASMSHEIRTPMNAIFGFTQLLGDLVTGERERQYVRAISTSGESLLTLINDILDLSKIESGQLDLHPEPVDPRALVDGVLVMFSQMAADRGLSLRADVAPTVPLALELDPTRIRQILNNLVSNAIKYTDSGGVVLRAHCEVRNRQHLLHLVVEDSGIGIASEQLARMFEPFVQGVFEPGRRVEGAGLGLSITRRLVASMGGEIRVASEPGGGSVFDVSIPTREHTATLSSSPAPRSSVSLDRLKPLTVLIVDDVALNRELLNAIFLDSGHRVLEAEDGEQALARAAEVVPDVVLMDVRMPGMGGHLAMRTMRAQRRYDGTRIIAITASSLRDEERALRIEFDGYVRKPFTREEVIDEIARVIRHDASDESGDASDSPASAPSERAHATPAGADAVSVAQAHTQLGLLRTQRWEPLSRSLAMRELGEFARDVGEQARLAGLEPLISYAARLQQAVDLFDVTKAESLLLQFPAYFLERDDTNPDRNQA